MIGTSTSAEAREYFGDISKHEVSYVYSGAVDDSRIRMAFDADKGDERKLWIEGARTVRSYFS